MARGSGMPITRRRKRHTRTEPALAFPVSEYYRRLLSTPGGNSNPTFRDYQEAASASML
jgi:hypothetical protein